MEIHHHKIRIVIVSIIIVLSLFTLWMRLLPAPQLISGNNYLLGQEPDISYNLRLIEQTLSNFPHYPVYEVMTRYPYGTIVFWGPMYTMIISILCILAGASTRPEIANIAFLVPPLMAVAMVPVMYVLGRTLVDWKTGLLSALFISIVSGQFVYRSLFGFADHHIAEVLFSTIFCLMYIFSLVYSREHDVDLKHFQTLKVPLILSIGTGVTFLLGLYTMPTMVLFAFIVSIFTFFQIIWDFYRNRKSDYLLLINGITFLIAILGMLVIGFNNLEPTLVNYSPAHVVAYAAVIFGTVFLYIASLKLQVKKLYFPVVILGAIVVIFLISYVLLPQLYSSFIGALSLFFGFIPVTYTVQELRPWSLSEAWLTFNFGLILAIAGILILLYRNYREEKPDHIFVLFWGILILISAFQHVRYEYYLGPVIALLAALCVGNAFSVSWKDTWAFVLPKKPNVQEDDEKSSSKKKGKPEKKKIAKKSYDPLMVALFFFTAALGVLFVGMSANYNYQVGNAMGYNIMHPDWRETLEWMGNNTPDPGVDYDTLYDKATFSYPPQSYGVMSWWDYGHWITFFAKRIPHANPFQEGVDGPNGAASFFLAPTEEGAISIANNLTTKFVVTDIEMDIGKFWAMSTWFNQTLGDRPYHQVYLVTSPDNPTTYEPVSLTTQAYYLTMISRLHNFDGSLTESSVAYYIEYRDGTTATRYYPIVTRVDVMNASEAVVMATDYNRNAPTGSHATVLSTSLTSPISKVPALQHFRLIHESPTNVMGNSGDLRYVKAFEYVRGAHIKGEGVIEIPLVTNGGRTFVYRQESVNGEFIVPYPTEGSLYDVKATGPYRISGTNSTFTVNEYAIQQGLTIN